MKLFLTTVALLALFNVNGAFGSPECGKVLLNKDKSNGKEGSTLEGQWPWQVALYQQKSGLNPRYICGGTLVSKRHVITVVHCTRTLGGTKMNLTAYLGKHNLNDLGEKVQGSMVTGIRLHPEYNKDTFTKNLAILELQSSITFSDWVQPACLWPDSETEIKNIIGQTGSVAGWGFNEKGEGIEEQSLLGMPVVSRETCIRTNTESFARFISESAYCAGSTDSNVCNGVSGVGMFFEKDSSWYLRGILSLSLAKSNELSCDPTKYTIFADVAQDLPWIKENIKDD